RFFKKRLESWEILLRAPDLNTPSFADLTLTAMIDRVGQELADCQEPVFLISSSLGAMVALHSIEKARKQDGAKVKKMMLLAPSFDFARNYLGKLSPEERARWQSTGRRRIYHYMLRKDFEVSYRLIQDTLTFDSSQLRLEIPTLIFHGLRDGDVSHEQSIRFADSRSEVRLRVLDSDHRLLDQLDRIWADAVDFFDLCDLTEDRHPAIKVRPYYISRAEDAARFKPHESGLLAILKAAYGETAYDRAVHLSRIYGEQHLVLLAFVGSPERENIVGCSYIRPDGKRSALALHPEYQGRGIGRRLLCTSLALLPEQFTEISPSNQRMRHLLVSCGFQQVTSEAVLRRRLGKDASLVHSVNHRGHDVIYRRWSANHRGMDHEFVMFERIPEHT
ncbi:MAG: GNAT family N-acetyltransferase, partial [Thermoanaerobaculia bacterium]